MATIHPTALIDPGAEIDDSVEIGPYCIIESDVQIAAGCVLQASAQVCAHVRVGPDCRIGRGAILGETPQDLGFKLDTRSYLEIGAKNEFREYVTIHRGAKDESVTRIGNGNYFMVSSHVGHDSQVGDENIIANACLIAGHVTIGNRAFLGGGSAFHQFIRVGDLAITQGNARISQDIPPYTMASGLNTLAGLNSIGLRRAEFSPEIRRQIKQAYQLLHRSEKNLNEALEEAGQMTWSDEAAKFLEFHRTPSHQGICRARNKRSKNKDS